MSTSTQLEAIVIHGPLNGNSDAIREVEPSIATAVSPDPESRPVRPRSPTLDALQGRAAGLDAFRGFFLLLMTFAMTIPMKAGLFPQWMYHMQFPPPGDFVERAGLTWRDLMFPGFLFTMCTAIPITNTLRLSKGMPYPAVIWQAVRRFALLYLFALLIGHVNPYWTHDYTKRGNVVAIMGFLICWPIFLRKPASWSPKFFQSFKRAGWIAAAATLCVLPRAYGLTFSTEHIDGIIQALAFVSFSATVLWLFTRNRPKIRVGIFAILVGLKLLSAQPGAIDILGNMRMPPLFEGWMVELLLVGIPGTLAGDLLLRWMRQRDEAAAVQWSRARLLGLALLAVAFAPVGVVGFYNQQIMATAAMVGALGIFGFAVLQNPQTDRERVLARLYYAAAAFTLIGALLAAISGGVKKDPQTLGYLVYTTGVSIGILTAALIFTDVLKLGGRIRGLIIDVGQNPLLAYVAYMLFLNHIAYGTGVGDVFTSTWPAAIARGLVFTAATGALVVAATRKKLFWRA